MRLQANGAAVYSVSYSYRFQNVAGVVVEGLGSVSPAGQLRYLSPGRHVNFRAVGTGALLATLPLEETVFVAALTPVADLPRQSDFPAQSEIELARIPAPVFRSSIFQVLNRYFQCMPRDDGPVSYIWTTYSPLQIENGPKNILGRIAIQISFPFERNPDGFQFRIQALIREGRPQSEDWRPPETQAVVDAGNGFVKRLARELAAVKGGN